MNIDFELNPTPQKLSILINNCTGSILERTYPVSIDDLAEFGQSLWQSAEYLESIFQATETLGYTISSIDRLGKQIKCETIDELSQPDWPKVYQLQDAAAELVKIKKSVVLDVISKSNLALKIAQEIGLNDVNDYRSRVLELNVILQERIRKTTEQ